jgi:hypothetical protein
VIVRDLAVAKQIVAVAQRLSKGCDLAGVQSAARR